MSQITIPDRTSEIILIIELLKRVNLYRITNPSDYNKNIGLAKRGLDLIFEELVDQVRKNSEVANN